jgi:hypothetical protein
MRDKNRASRIRQQISGKLRERRFIEGNLLKRRDMIAACLIARHLGSSEEKRKTPSYYLSGKVSGKTMLRHVRKEDLGRVRKRTEAWRKFSGLMAKWHKLDAEIGRLLRELGSAQSEKPFGKEEDGQRV